MGDDKRHITDTKKNVSKNADVDFHAPNTQDFNFIKDKPTVIFLLNKIERLSGVVHLLTSGLSDREPLRQATREEVVGLFKEALSLAFLKGVETSLERRIAACISLINMGKISMVISPMNASILNVEFNKLFELVELIRDEESRVASFDTGALSGDSTYRNFPGNSYKGHKSQANVLYNNNKRTEVFNVPLPEREIKNRDEKVFGNNDSTREKMILEIIRTKGDVSIKDITLLIKGVSMKTIQRDLVRMVAKRTLNKTGERRWSRYSISK